MRKEEEQEEGENEKKTMESLQGLRKLSPMRSNLNV
jgi:hypothetical protein